MGGMKDEAKRITIPPLFPRVHVNDTGRGGLSQPFDGKTMPLYKRSTKNISDSPSSLSLSLPPPPNSPRLTGRPEKKQFSPFSNTSPPSKFEDKKGMNYPSPTGSSVAKPQYHSNSKYLPNLESLKLPAVRVSETDPKANTDLSLQFCTNSSSKATASKNLPFREILLENHESQNMSVDVMKTQLYGFNNETQKKPKTLPHLSDSCVIDSLSGMSASSNDVARVIGDKRFWKMRTYMINQQKIFAGQVFELHRLIMVQKMVAKSPNLVLQTKHEMAAASKVKKPKTENHKLVIEDYPEHMKPKLPLPVNPVWGQQLLPPPGNQWLVPVISPSEGLVYKPYAGPCPPPSSAFMVPLYGQDSLRFPQFSPTIFPPRTTTLDQTFQRWSTTSSHMTQAIPFSLKKSQESNDSEVHGSTASSPPEKHKFEVLPLFPTEPTHQTDHENKQPIKSIPHNPTSASESAARIFRCIQEERRDSDHMIS